MNKLIYDDLRGPCEYIFNKLYIQVNYSFKIPQSFSVSHSVISISVECKKKSKMSQLTQHCGIVNPQPFTGTYNAM